MQQRWELRSGTEAGTPEQHALAVAALLDENLARDSLDQITVCLDVRGSEGWPNPPAYTMLAPVQAIARLLLDNFPERCRRIIVYPMPWGAFLRKLVNGLHSHPYPLATSLSLFRSHLSRTATTPSVRTDSCALDAHK